MAALLGEGDGVFAALQLDLRDLILLDHLYQFAELDLHRPSICGVTDDVVDTDGNDQRPDNERDNAGEILPAVVVLIRFLVILQRHDPLYMQKQSVVTNQQNII